MAETALIFTENKTGTVSMSLPDNKYGDEVYKYITEENKDEWLKMQSMIFDGAILKERYQKISINSFCSQMYEMRFRSKGRNDRIYCKQYEESSGNLIIVMAELFRGKKTQKIDKVQQKRITNIGKTDFNTLQDE